MFDPIFANELKVWYNGLYRGERYLVLLGAFIFLLIMILWVTK